MEKKFVPRLIETKILQLAKEFPVVCVTGPRQTGKSTLLKKTFPNYSYITLDDPILRERFIKDASTALDMLDVPCIIDEIQYAPQILPYLKMRVDEKRVNGQYVLSGSQMFNLMQGLSESLAGRVGLCELFSLSNEELFGKNCFCQPADFLQKCIVGGYPEPAVHFVNSQNFYASYLQTYLERDVRQIRSVHDLSVFQRFVELLASRAGGILNLSEISRDCGISHTLASQWLSLLESTRIVYLLRPYFVNISKRMVKSPKIYFTDTGLLCYLLKYYDAKNLWAGPSAGHVFENAMIVEWLKYKANTLGNFGLYYLRDSQGNEIDLLLDLGQKKIAFEFKMGQNPMESDLKAVKILLEGIEHQGYLVSSYKDNLKYQDNLFAISWGKMCSEMGEFFKL